MDANDKKLEIDDYTRNLCPECGQGFTDHYHVSFYEEKCTVYWLCYKCDAKWLEKYDLDLVRYQKTAQVKD